MTDVGLKHGQHRFETHAGLKLIQSHRKGEGGNPTLSCTKVMMLVTRAELLACPLLSLPSLACEEEHQHYNQVICEQEERMLHPSSHWHRCLPKGIRQFLGG